jgi:predicted DNA-binding transcriptional regulator AlpA
VVAGYTQPSAGNQRVLTTGRTNLARLAKGRRRATVATDLFIVTPVGVAEVLGVSHAVTTELQDHLLAQAADDRLIRERDVLRLLCICRAKLAKEISQGAIPRPVRVGGCRRWRLSQIRQVMTEGT